MNSLIPQELKDKALTKNINGWAVNDHIKNLCNIVEDRRIDNFIYTKAPGYREYYLKLYDFYFCCWISFSTNKSIASCLDQFL